MDVTAVEKKIRQIDKTMQTIAQSDYASQLLTIVHRPGWTTPQEAQLVHALLDGLQHQLEGTKQMHEQLLAAADQIGKPAPV